MKLKVLAVSLLAFFAVIGSANAFVWHLRVSTARHETERFMKQYCEEESECLAWAGSKCLRNSESAVECQGAVWTPGYSIEEETECYFTLHWGVSYSGTVALKNHGQVKCITVAAAG